jgi:hypothetical protein
MSGLAHPTPKLTALVCAVMLAATMSAAAKDGETRACETKLGGQVVCGDRLSGSRLITWQGSSRRSEEIQQSRTFA